MPAIPVHHTATVERPWDAGAALRAAPNDAAVLRYMHAAVRAGADPELKGSYVLPHHPPGTDTPAVLPGVRNALARLSQVQGLSAAERDGAERHLRAHLADAQQ